MIYKSALITAASGSIDGLVASHNKGGQYFRQLVIPTNPNSPQQATVRALVAQLANLWSTVLTADERTLWDFYAFNVPLTNALGDPINVTGFNMYVRSNVPRLQAGLSRIDAGPTTFNLGDFTFPSFAIDATDDEVDVTFDDTDGWASETDAAMMVWCSRPRSVTTQFFKGPYRFAGLIAGVTGMPPASPAAIALPFTAAVGQRVFVKVSVCRADGRLSQPFRGFGLGA